ncbi:N-acetylmuramic acid 6-phosphate etherase [Pseudoroseicyclus aestuarii]|uniref:N-acetylmuramic acid 6-phosphate etherase n=1 Tax=Pseudoroseicyclus aestuarii TaxID=1795041 RepID=A0A318TBA5_9RHOB|nr:N-acetylmuramic acid 6-phosphate etherase [Pseudoroseicyclus aestuarii]PYE85608.1 N-acetylmuramic acid 6-phosphate etherase [Pseudoroseicyclus aestuarii]
MSTTETAAPRYAGIETWPTADLVAAMIEGQMAATASLLPAAPAIARAVEHGAKRLARGGRLIYLGAGTSGRLATLDAAELPPTFGWPAERALALMAGGPAAVTGAVEGAEDDGAAAIAALKAAGLGEADVVIGLAASGRTPFVAEGLRHARAEGALTLAIFCNEGGPLGEIAEIPILVATGAEVLAGSTRMKAGTAQKAVLTVLSTGIFTAMGYVHRGRMVEMAPTNEKLAARARRMIADLADVPEAEAQAALEAGGSIKTALVMLELGLDRDAAEARLAASGGRLHRALAAPLSAG